ncbi:MAG: DUF6478 family protein [Litoreibacter sp.]
MPQRLKDFGHKLLHLVSIRRWQSAIESADTVDLDSLKKLRIQAAQLRKQVEKFTHIANGRLALPRIGSNAIRKPAQADWSYRPEIWRGPISPFGIAAIRSKTRVGTAATLYHDCKTSEITIRQVRNTRENDLAPFGLRMDVFKFDGSFLSLLLELPDSIIDGLRGNHVIAINAELESEKSLKVFARLNIKFGPNVEQIVCELPSGDKNTMVEFDLAHIQINEKRLERIWVDLTFEDPQMNEINLRDINFNRRPRADF